MKKLTNSEFLERVNNICKGEFIICDSYKGRKSKIKVLHNVKSCMRIFETTPESLLRGRGCNICSNNTRKTTKQYKKEIFDETSGEYELKSEYINNQTYVTILHNKCGQEYKVRPLNFTKGRRCPYCVKKGITEKEIYKTLKSIYGNRVHSQPYFKDLLSDKGVYLRYDISLDLNGKKYLMEYNGEQHYKPMRFNNSKEKFIMTQQHDKLKKSYALKHGYVYIELPYNKDWENILSKEYEIKVKI